MEESKYVQLMRERFDHGQEMTYAEEALFLWLLNAPDAYQNEEQMLKYAEEHPNATMDELNEYWESITPDGLPPGMDSDELLRDDDEEEDL